MMLWYRYRLLLHPWLINGRTLLPSIVYLLSIMLLGWWAHKAKVFVRDRHSLNAEIIGRRVKGARQQNHSSSDYYLR